MISDILTVETKFNILVYANSRWERILARSDEEFEDFKQGVISKEERGVLLYLNIAGSSTEALLSSLGVQFEQPPQEEKGPKSLRELGTGAQILLQLGVRKMRLLTNTPRKIVGLEGFGLNIVEFIPLESAE